MKQNIFKFVASLSMILVFIFNSSTLTAGETQLSDQKKLARINEMYRKYQKDFPDVAYISAEKALRLSEQQQIVFIDTRKPAEQAISMLPNAITREMLLKDPSQIEGKTAVVYCTVGYRSGVIAEKLADRGLSLTNLAGGILAWVHAGGKVYDGEGETKRIHVYGKRWDYAPQGYDTVLFGFLEQITNMN